MSDSARQAGQNERSKRDKASNLHPYQPASQRVDAPIDLAALLGDGLLDAVKAGVGLAILLGQLLGDAFQPSNAAVVVLGLCYRLLGHGVALMDTCCWALGTNEGTAAHELASPHQR